MIPVTNMKKLNAIAENFPHKRLFINKSGNLGVVTNGTIIDEGEVSAKEYVDFYNLDTIDSCNIELISHEKFNSSDIAKQECFKIRKHHLSSYTISNTLVPAFILSPINIYTDSESVGDGINVGNTGPSSNSFKIGTEKDYYCIKSKNPKMLFNNICIPRNIDVASIDEMKNNLLFMMSTCSREEPVWSGVSVIKYYNEEEDEVIDLNAVWDNNIFLIEETKYNDNIISYSCYNMNDVKNLFSHIYERIREINNLIAVNCTFEKVLQKPKM